MELNERIADALEEAQKVCVEDIIPSAKLMPRTREILTNAGYLVRIVRGWYMLVRAESSGSSTPWFSMYWPFLRQYLKHRFGEKGYCLSPQSSLDIYSGETTIPNQLVVLTLKSSNTTVKLPYNVSLLLYQDEKAIPESFEIRNGINLMPLAYSLIKVSPVYFQNKPHNIEIALSMIETESDITRVLVETRGVTASERIAGAYEQIGNSAAAQTILNDMKLAGFTIKPINPFVKFIPSIRERRFKSPYVPRIISLWKSFREDILNIFPPSMLPVSTVNIDKIIKDIEDRAKEDAYHSLSIEGYKITDELIRKIREGDWNPDTNDSDSTQRDALAARGYSLAHHAVVQTIRAVLNGENAGRRIRNDLSVWYRELNHPLLQAGIIKPSDIIGFRKSPVYIRNAMHVPPPYEAVVDSMNAFFELLENEYHGGVRAVLGHYFFVYIHPYMDGNGRLARFIMNLMLVSAGYPWTIIKVSERTEYMQTLDLVAADKNIMPFIKFIIKEMNSH